jgi:GR25 family glycosyltransferase involved in LPS biosynthesis
MEKEFGRLAKWAQENESGEDRPPVKFIDAIRPGHAMFKKYISIPGKVDTGFGTEPRCFCVDEGEQGADRKKCMHRRRKMKATEIAICLSHYCVYQDMIKNNLQWAMICEDDIRFSEGFSEMMDVVIGSGKIGGGLDDIWVTGEPVMICLGGRNQPGEETRWKKKAGGGRFKMHRSQKAIYSNYCYLINYAAAELLVEHFWPIVRPEDSYKRWLSNQGLLVSYVIRPSMIQELSAGINSGRPIFHRLSKANNLDMVPEMRGSEEASLGVEVKGGVRMRKKDPIENDKRSVRVNARGKERILITTGRFGRRTKKEK